MHKLFWLYFEFKLLNGIGKDFSEIIKDFISWKDK